MPLLKPAERDAFLTEPGILMRVAVTRVDGSPLVTPIWFAFEEAAIYFTPRAKSEWFECLRHDARVALCIDEQSLPYRKVIVEGAAELVFDVGHDDAWRELYGRIARRYVPEQAAEDYIRDTIDQPRGLYRVALRDAKVKSWRMPLEGEAPEGIWHHRYYARGSKFAE